MNVAAAAVVAALGLASAEHWLVIAGGLGVVWFLIRGGGGTAITQLEAANRVLVTRLDTLEREGLEKDRRIAELEAKTDVTVATTTAIQPLLKQTENYERRAEERHLLTLSILQMIADRLGPDPDLTPEAT